MTNSSYEKLMLNTKLKMEASEALSGIQDLLFVFSSVYPTKLNAEARKYLHQGALNRILTIEENYRWLFFTLSPDRVKPLGTEDARRAGTYLNSLYLHSKGVIDNFAWLFLCQLDTEKAKRIVPTKVYLHSKEVMELLPECQEKSNLLKLSDWTREVAKMRSPIAHRLPLAIPPQILNEEQSQRYLELDLEHNEVTNQFFAVVSKNLSDQKMEECSVEELEKRKEIIDDLNKVLESKIKSINNERENLGYFVPMFGHLAEDKMFPIYPTIPEDLTNLTLLTKECLAIIKLITTAPESSPSSDPAPGS